MGRQCSNAFPGKNLRGPECGPCAANAPLAAADVAPSGAGVLDKSAKAGADEKSDARRLLAGGKMGLADPAGKLYHAGFTAALFAGSRTKHPGAARSKLGSPTLNRSRKKWPTR